MSTDEQKYYVGLRRAGETNASFTILEFTDESVALYVYETLDEVDWLHVELVAVP